MVQISNKSILRIWPKQIWYTKFVLFDLFVHITIFSQICSSSFPCGHTLLTKTWFWRPICQFSPGCPFLPWRNKLFHTVYYTILFDSMGCYIGIMDGGSKRIWFHSIKSHHCLSIWNTDDQKSDWSAYCFHLSIFQPLWKFGHLFYCSNFPVYQIPVCTKYVLQISLCNSSRRTSFIFSKINHILSFLKIRL